MFCKLLMFYSFVKVSSKTKKPFRKKDIFFNILKSNSLEIVNETTDL